MVADSERSERADRGLDPGPFRDDGSPTDRAARKYAAALRRSTTALRRTTDRVLTSRLSSLAKFTPEGKLTPESRRAIVLAARSIEREHAKTQAAKAAEEEVDEHLDRMEVVAERTLRDDMRDAAIAAAVIALLMRRAREGVRTDRTRRRARRRNLQLWGDVPRQHARRLAAETVAVLERTGRVSSAVERIREVNALTRRRGDRIGAFEADTSLSEFSRDYHRAIGVDRYTWRTQRDDRVREEHEAREGRAFEWSSPPADGHPGEPPNCRCWSEPIFGDLAEPAEGSAE